VPNSTRQASLLVMYVGLCPRMAWVKATWLYSSTATMTVTDRSNSSIASSSTILKSSPAKFELLLNHVEAPGVAVASPAASGILI
jgi:hypothetical protein